MVTNGLTKLLLKAQKHNIFVKITSIKNQKNLLSFIKKKKDIFQQLQTYSKYGEVCKFGINIIWYVQEYFC